VLHVAQNFDVETAMEKLDEIEENILLLEDNPYLGTAPKYPVLRRQGYRVLVLKKDLVFYKIDENKKEVVVHVVVDQRQDYLRIIQGL
jgi:toxin ParE1/3/4